MTGLCLYKFSISSCWFSSLTWCCFGLCARACGPGRERSLRLKAIARLAQSERDLLNQVQENLAEARRHGLSQREALRQEGAQAEASLLEKVKQEVDAEWAKVEKKIKEDMAKARKALQAQVQDFAQALAAKIIGRELS